jgi:uncharacterized caspase-like protein
VAARSALIIANDTFDDPGIPPLDAPKHDARALAEVLGDASIGGFSVDLALNEPEWVLRERIGTFFEDREREDLLLLHISSHGIKDPRGQLYFACVNTKLADPEATALAAEYVNRRMDRGRSAQLLLLDCCFSGAVGRGDRLRSPDTVTFDELRGGGTGRVIITATNALEYAIDGDHMTGEGAPAYFTRSVVGGLRTGEADRDGDGRISVDELFSYVREAVRELTPNQTPKRISDVDGDLYIARSVRGARSPARSEPIHRWTRQERRQFRERLQRCLDALARMLSENRFDADGTAGLIVESHVVTPTGLPTASLARTAVDGADQREWGAAVIGTPAGEGHFDATSIEASLDAADTRVSAAGARRVMVGILPTLFEEDVNEHLLSELPRAQLINREILERRGEELDISIRGVERIGMYLESIAPVACCAGLHISQVVHPEMFARHWNAAQAVAGIQVAVGANAPFFAGRELWRETRIALLEQALDVRNEDLRAQGNRPLVWFGERWITSVFDLYEENLRYFAPLLPDLSNEDPVEVLERGDVPRLDELTRHNDTIFRWNRPRYQVERGRPRFAIENRVLASGPTAVDVAANVAFFHGLVWALIEDERPIWSQISFSAAEDNFHAGARDGLDARVYWPGVGEVHVSELVLRRLLPRAQDALQRRGIEPIEIERAMGIIRGRCERQANGATWQSQRYQHLRDAGGLDRVTALREMTLRYAELAASGEPVHEWPVT